MVKEINAYDARKNFGELLSQVYYRGDQVIINRSGKPVAAMVPVDWLKQWRQRRESFFRRVEAIGECNKDIAPGVIEKEIEEAVAGVRGAKRRRKSGGLD